MRRLALLSYVSRRIDSFVPPALLHDSPEDARRARLAVGIGFLLVPVFALPVVVHLLNGNVLEAELNGLLGVIIGGTPLMLRATGRFLVVINGILAIAFAVVVGALPEVHERVKDAAGSAKPLGEGTGLGLALAEAIVRRFGGRLEIDTRGRGTIAKVVLAAAESPGTSLPVLTSRAPEGPPARTLRVLVIDDEPLVARAFARILRRHTVAVVGSGREGVARLSAGEEFDLVFCDVMMPDLSGMGVFDALYDARPELAERIVFMTGGIFTDRASEFRARVPNTFIDKPIDAGVVARIIADRSAALGGAPGEQGRGSVAGA